MKPSTAGKNWIIFIRFMLVKESMKPSKATYKSAFPTLQDREPEDDNPVSTYEYSTSDSGNELDDTSDKASKNPPSITEILGRELSRLPPYARCTYFSDQCYIVTEKLFDSSAQSDVASVLRVLRYEFFRYGYFFKGSIQEGEFDFVDVSNSKNRVRGISVLGDVLPVQLNEENFKGVGFACSSVEMKLDSFGYNFIESLYISKQSPRVYTPYLDIRYNQKEIGYPIRRILESEKNRVKEISESIKPIFIDNRFDDVDSPAGIYGINKEQRAALVFIETFLDALFQAKVKSNSYMRFYLPALIAMIRSSDFSKLFIDSSDEWNGQPLIFRYLYIVARVRKKIASVAMLRSVFLVIAERVIEETGEKRTFSDMDKAVFCSRKSYRVSDSLSPEMAMKQMIRIKMVRQLEGFGLLKSLEDAPEGLIDYRIKDEISKISANQDIKGSLV